MRVQVGIKKGRLTLKESFLFFFLSFFLLLTWLALRRRTIAGRSYFPRVIGLDTTPTFSFLPARFPIISSVGCRSLPRPEDRFCQGDPSFVTGRPGKVSRGKRKSPCFSLSLILSPHDHVNRQSFFFSLSLIPCLFFFLIRQTHSHYLRFLSREVRWNEAWFCFETFSKISIFCLY